MFSLVLVHSLQQSLDKLWIRCGLVAFEPILHSNTVQPERLNNIDLLIFPRITLFHFNEWLLEPFVLFETRIRMNYYVVVLRPTKRGQRLLSKRYTNGPIKLLTSFMLSISNGQHCCVLQQPFSSVRLHETKNIFGNIPKNISIFMGDPSYCFLSIHPRMCSIIKLRSLIFDLPV